jgi:hypothetical protein
MNSGERTLRCQLGELQFIQIEYLHSELNRNRHDARVPWIRIHTSVCTGHFGMLASARDVQCNHAHKGKILKYANVSSDV